MGSEKGERGKDGEADTRPKENRRPGKGGGWRRMMRVTPPGRG